MGEYNPLAIDVMGASEGVIGEILECGEGSLVCAGVSGSQVVDEVDGVGSLRASTDEECAFWTLQSFFEAKFDLRKEDLPRQVSQWLLEKSKELRTLADQVLEVLDDRDVATIRGYISGR